MPNLLTAAVASFLVFTSPDQAADKTTQARVAAIYLPSEPHRDLAKLAGTWEQEAVFASGGTPVRATGRVVNRAVLGGRFIVSEGNATGASSFDYGSMLVFGFDGRTREHTVLLFDSFGTYFVEARRPASEDPGAKELKLSGETREGTTPKAFDVVLTWIDADTYRLEIVFRLPGRPPSVAVSFTCKRVAQTQAR
jgi:hypothetical protein